MSKRAKPHVHPVDEAWLALSSETRIEPDIDIVDSHVHLWDFSDPNYFADSYIRDAKSAGISSSVYVDCTMAYREDGPVELEPVGEVEFAYAQANTSPHDVSVAAGIIGWADLTLGKDVGHVLDALEVAGRGHFRGIRTRATYDLDTAAGYGALGVGPSHILRSDFMLGAEQLHAQGHVLDLYAFHTQLNEVADLARALPGLPIILNHIGGPLGVGRYADIGEQVFADWAQGMTDVASCPNVQVKISGFAISRIAIVPLHAREQIVAYYAHYYGDPSGEARSRRSGLMSGAATTSIGSLRGGGGGGGGLAQPASRANGAAHTTLLLSSFMPIPCCGLMTSELQSVQLAACAA